MWEYLKDHRKIGLFLVTAAAVEGLVFWLYHLPAAAVAYASVIIAFFGMALAVPDFLGYRRRHQALLRMREEIGIAPEDLPRIFEKGYTGENGRLDKRASGIGLYLCSRICENLGHRIRAESAVGQGTRVYLELKPFGSADVWNLSKM